MSDWELNEEIQIFREYLRIPSVHPDINYGKFARFELSEVFFFFEENFHYICSLHR